MHAYEFPFDANSPYDDISHSQLRDITDARKTWPKPPPTHCVYSTPISMKSFAHFAKLCDAIFSAYLKRDKKWYFANRVWCE